MNPEVEKVVEAVLPRVALGMPVADIVTLLNDDFKHIKPKRRAKLVSLAVLEIVRRKNENA